MRITVGMVKLASLTTLALLAICGAYLNFDRGDAAFAAAPAWGAHLLAAYAAASLSFAAFPRTRRSDLARIVFMGLLLMEVTDRLMFGAWPIANMVADAAGAYAVFASSCLERLRTLIREQPDAPFTGVYPGDRRRRRRGVKASPVATSLG